MFVQVIKARTKDPEGMRRRGKVWREEVGPGAVGYLGSTAGTTDDGTFIAIVRFADEASARANSDRPAQTKWFEETAKYFDGEPSFRESSDTTRLFDGGSDEAGFVQIMEGRVSDRTRLEALETSELSDQLRAARPDLIGSLRVWFPDDSFVEAAYFTSEEAARKGEASPDFEGPSQEYGALHSVVAFTDLRDPDLHSA